MAVGAFRADSLRLVNGGAVPARRTLRRDNAAEPATVDPRWVLAVAAARMLEGGRAAILPNESREHVLRLASNLGLRAFDAALVMAIVQDAARRGEPLGGEVAERLRLVPALREATPGSPGSLLMAACVLALVMLAALLGLVS